MAKTCRQCNDPGCVSQCPAQVDVPKFVGHIANREFREAYETIRRANVLAAVCGYVCPSETLCQSGCINQHYDESVPIRHLQRWVSRKAVEEGWAGESRPHASPSGKRVAVLGAGPAGIAAAVKLACLGHQATLFDRTRAGGMARETIPGDRLPDDILSREIELVLAGAGDLVRRREASIGDSIDVDGILAEGFDAVLLALGLSRSAELPGAARPRTGVTGALEFLAAAKSGAWDTVAETVLVLGGGNTAIDAAVTAKRCGARDVSIVYRRSFAEMPAWPAERDEALRRGVNFLVLTQPLDYVSDAGGRLTGLRVARTQLGAPDASGRRRPLEIPGTEHVIPAALVIEAIGQSVDEPLRRALSGVEFTRSGLVRTRGGSFETTRPAVFAAGDIVNGGTTVVQAVAEGKRAAREIHRRMIEKPDPAALPR